MSYQLLKEKDESEINTPEINENPDLQNSNNFLICLQCCRIPSITLVQFELSKILVKCDCKFEKEYGVDEYFSLSAQVISTK